MSKQIPIVLPSLSSYSEDRVTDETFWTDPKANTTYRKSKTLAELAAWQFRNVTVSQRGLTSDGFNTMENKMGKK